MVTDAPRHAQQLLGPPEVRAALLALLDAGAMAQLDQHGIIVRYNEPRPGRAAETSPAVQALYRRYGDEAEALGVFGAPTYVLAGERFWGQDRLEFLDRALDGLRARL